MRYQVDRESGTHHSHRRPGVQHHRCGGRAADQLRRGRTFGRRRTTPSPTTRSHWGNVHEADHSDLRRCDEDIILCTSTTSTQTISIGSSACSTPWRTRSRALLRACAPSRPPRAAVCAPARRGAARRWPVAASPPPRCPVARAAPTAPCARPGRGSPSPAQPRNARRRHQGAQSRKHRTGRAPEGAPTLYTVTGSARLGRFGALPGGGFPTHPPRVPIEHAEHPPPKSARRRHVQPRAAAYHQGGRVITLSTTFVVDNRPH